MKYGSLFDRIVRVYGSTSKLVLRDRAFWPVLVMIETTSRCNLRCSLCVFGARVDSELDKERRSRELTTDEIRSVIDQVPRATLITFTGGEPFIRKDMLDLIEYAGRRHRCHVITNATLIDETAARRLAELGARHAFGTGLVFIGVSLQGDKETHDRVTGRAGSFDKAVETIRLVQQHKESLGRQFPRFHITTVINDATIEHLPAMVEKAAGLGVGTCNFPLETRFLDEHIARGVEAADFGRSPCYPAGIAEPVLRECHDRTEQIARQLNVTLRWPRMPFADVAAYYENRFDSSGFQCYAPWTKMLISQHGAVHPCNFMELGNVREQPIFDIWNGEKFRAFRRKLRSENVFPICPGCCDLVKWR